MRNESVFALLALATAALLAVGCSDGGTSPGDGGTPPEDGAITPGDGAVPDGGSADSDAGPLAPSFVVRCQTKGSAVASPAYCNFDATSTASGDPNVDAFHDLDYAWDFGDPQSGSWPYGRKTPRNEDLDPIAAHVFSCSAPKCTYEVKLTVRDAAGHSRAVSKSVDVVSEDAAWPAGDTRCVRPVTGGTFNGCPAGAAQITSDDYAASLLTAKGKRTLFECGKTFHAAQSPMIANAAGDGSLVGGYGACDASPAIVRVDFDGDLHIGGNTEGWRVRDVRYDASGLPSNQDGKPAVWGLHGGSAPFAGGALLYRSEFRSVGTCPMWTQLYVTSSWIDLVGVFDSYCEQTDGAPGVWQLGMWSVRYGAWQGYRLEAKTNPTTGYNGWRGMGQSESAFKHDAVRFLTPVSSTMQWRSCAGAKGTACTRDDQHVVVADNDFFDDSAEVGSVVRLLNSHDGVEQGLSAAKRDWIVRGNTFSFGNSRPRCLQSVIRLDGVERVSVRDNVIDLRGLPAGACTTRMVQWASLAGTPNGPSAVYGNTLLGSDATPARTYVGCAAGAVTLSGRNQCLSNLLYEGSRSAGVVVSDGAWTNATANVALFQSAACPFAGATGTCDLSAPSLGWSADEAKVRSSGGGRASVVDKGFAYPKDGSGGSALREDRKSVV